MSNKNNILNAILENKNQEVLNELYKSILPKVNTYILNNSGNTEDAKDIFQDAVVSFFHAVKTGRFDRDKSIDAYIYTIAKNAWMNKVRKDKNLKFKETLPDENPIPESNQLELLITKERQEAFQMVFKQLGSQCKEIMKLSIYENLPPRKIMERLGLSSIEVTRTTAYRCRKKLTELVKANKGLLTIAE